MTLLDSSLNQRCFTVIVASAYKEGSITAIAEGLQRNGLLQRFYTTCSANQATALKSLPVIGPAVAREFGRRSFGTIKPDRIRTVGTFPELLHVGIRRLLPGRSPSGLMYWVKSRFDIDVAQAIQADHSHVVIGMWGSCLSTFRAAGAKRLKVLNFVNSRPSYHNRFLRDLAQLGSHHSEMVPQRTCDLVEREMEIADLVLVPSEFVALQMAEYRTKVAVVPYGVDTSIFSGPSRRLDQDFNVLFVGQISHRKGISTLLAAARKMPNIRFTMIGPRVSPELLHELPSNVSYLGSAIHDELPSAMRSASVLVLPSFEDSYGLVTAEAMSAGIPVVVSGNCGSSELISHGQDGLVFPAGSVDEFIAAIELLARDRDLRERMGQAAEEKLRKSFTWEQYSDRVISRIAGMVPGVA